MFVMPDPSAAPEPGPDGTSSEADVSAETTDNAETTDGTETVPPFANRAARRAHAKGSAPRQSPGATGQFGRKGTVQGPRQWGNRRSG
jgi:hypothetical protein